MFNVEILIINFKKLFIRSNFFYLKLVISKILAILLLFTIFMNLHYFFLFFHKNCQVRKIRNQKNMLVVLCWGGGGGG